MPGEPGDQLRHLVVSIRTAAVGVDLYTPIETQIRTVVPIPRG